MYLVVPQAPTTLMDSLPNDIIRYHIVPYVYDSLYGVCRMLDDLVISYYERCGLTDKAAQRCIRCLKKTNDGRKLHQFMSKYDQLHIKFDDERTMAELAIFNPNYDIYSMIKLAYDETIRIFKNKSINTSLYKLDDGVMRFIARIKFYMHMDFTFGSYDNNANNFYNSYKINSCDKKKQCCKFLITVLNVLNEQLGCSDRYKIKTVKHGSYCGICNDMHPIGSHNFESVTYKANIGYVLKHNIDDKTVQSSEYRYIFSIAKFNRYTGKTNWFY